MIEIRGIKVRVEKGQQELEHQIMRKLRCKELPSYTILKRSIDARKKQDISRKKKSVYAGNTQNSYGYWSTNNK